MNARADKWLWAVRIFKTRTDAAEACRKGRVLVNGLEAKPSKELKTGDTVSVKRPPVTYSFKVLALIENRQPAKNVPLYAENITPGEELDRLADSQNAFFVQRDKGAGRPTKKERREIDKFDSELWDDKD